MRCDYSYQLAKWQCHSIDKTPTLRFKIVLDDEYPGGFEVVDCCPVCANLLEAELIKKGIKYYRYQITKEGGSDAVSS